MDPDPPPSSASTTAAYIARFRGGEPARPRESRSRPPSAGHGFWWLSSSSDDGCVSTLSSSRPVLDQADSQLPCTSKLLRSVPAPPGSTESAGDESPRDDVALLHSKEERVLQEDTGDVRQRYETLDEDKGVGEGINPYKYRTPKLTAPLRASGTEVDIVEEMKIKYREIVAELGVSSPFAQEGLSSTATGSDSMKALQVQVESVPESEAVIQRIRASLGLSEAVKTSPVPVSKLFTGDMLNPEQLVAWALKEECHDPKTSNPLQSKCDGQNVTSVVKDSPPDDLMEPRTAVHGKNPTLPTCGGQVEPQPIRTGNVSISHEEEKRSEEEDLVEWQEYEYDPVVTLLRNRLQDLENMRSSLLSRMDDAQRSLAAKVVDQDIVAWDIGNGLIIGQHRAHEPQLEVKSLRYIGGADISYSKKKGIPDCAYLVVLEWPSLEIVFESHAWVSEQSPYSPGYLAFREAPPLLDLLKQQRLERPDIDIDVLFVDGNGILHPRSAGVATHIGVCSGVRTIGVAKSFHCGSITPGAERSTNRKAISDAFVQKRMAGESQLPLYTANGRLAGVATCCCEVSTNPVFISVGYGVSLETSIELCRQLSPFRVPEPIRQADIRSRSELRKLESASFA